MSKKGMGLRAHQRRQMSRNPDYTMPLVSVAKLKRAREFILANPTMTKSQIILLTGMSDSTIARARRDLVVEGLIPAARNAPVQGVPLILPSDSSPGREPDEAAARTLGAEPPGLKAPSNKSGMLDHAAMLQLAEMVNVAVDAGDDALIQKMLIKQCLVFAFRVDLHPDTRMSASQMWGKLRDMDKAKDLGPGKPKTRADAVLRTRDVLIAVGPEITIEAVHLAFTVKESSNDEAPSDKTFPPGEPPQVTGPTGHAGDPAPADDLRSFDVGV